MKEIGNGLHYMKGTLWLITYEPSSTVTVKGVKFG